ncbi:type II toxin-antitoxin system RelE/ParE family toxin [Parvibaculum sp.]|uniref:type II toxin-antitoxin system RelE/ParE family toxin n=1 Tax=Parvibaculum sp. TaxID=2024848 RepID=UPI0032996B2D
MMTIRQTLVFSRWLAGLKDTKARARILVRIDRLALGNPGDVKPVGQGVSELRISYGPGYRVYFTGRGETLLLLLCGGDKGSQRRDIAEALALARRITSEDEGGSEIN